jgi:branched-subunit amino acid transport protein
VTLDSTGGRIALVVAVAAVTYLTRLVGFRLRPRRGADGQEGGVPPAVARFLDYVPIAAFAALVAPGIAEGSGSGLARAAAVGCAAAATLWARRLWAGLAAGLAGNWVVEAMARVV